LILTSSESKVLKDIKATHPLDQFLQQRMCEANISSKTLVFTFFCDVVTQHGGEIWLGSIIHALAPLGINERLTRTAVFRLQQDGWLESRKQGRRSYYQLTPTGQNYYQRAASRIYASSKPDWDGCWTLIFTSMVDEEKRDTLKRGLIWLGYGRLAAGLYALPGKQHSSLNELLADLDLQDSVMLMQARADDTDSLQKLVLSRWKLDDLRQRYRQFTSLYGNARAAMFDKKPADEHSLFLLRVLLIHEYRRILLADPELPAAMLPVDWEGYSAQTLTAEIYSELAAQTARWVNRELFNADGHMNGGSNDLKKRFSNSSSS
jgi:phenylacetic acid degradation operon negative regulatory protein